jgi:hypothetical protein
MPGRSACPSCNSCGVFPVLHWPDVPTNASLFLATAREARAYPRGSFRLVGCERCGLLFNADVDERLVEYSERSLESQASSARFNEFARRLAQTWVGRWELVGKTTLEIGCGRTPTFLDLFCSFTGGPGIGVDPIVDTSTRTALELLPSTFETAAVRIDADAVVCRHTLEHVSDVGAFLGALRAWGERHPRAIHLFEVPDVSRVLAETAFWDLYYEHCSYFSECSLRTTFTSAGFSVHEVATAYDGQYLLLAATLADRVDDGARACGDEMRALATGFAARADRAIRAATETLMALSREGPLVLWQASSKAAGLLTATRASECVSALVDVNPRKHGLFLVGSGVRVIAPHELRALEPRHVVVMNEIYLDEIRASLDAEAVSAKIHTAGELLGLEQTPPVREPQR